MLQAMQQPATAAPAPASSTFAGLLTALAARPSSPASRNPAWNDSGLADDVATLSYERALRTHARYRAPDAGNISFAQPAEPVQSANLELAPAQAEAAEASSIAGAGSEAEPVPDTYAFAAQEAAAAEDRNLKSASITIRLSRMESDQLRKRAAEAGLTVSAYLRSCTFEAEALRAMVKDTLAQLRSEPARAESAAAGPGRRSWRRWLGRLWLHLQPGVPAAQG